MVLVKKIFFSLLIFCFLSPLYGKDLTDLTILQNKSKEDADRSFKEFAKALDLTFNSGIGAIINVGYIQFGAECVLTPFEKSGVLVDSSTSIIPMPYLFGGITIPDIELIPFARLMILPVENNGRIPFIWGIGLAYEFDIIHSLSITPTVSLHNLLNYNQLNATSLALHLQIKYNYLFINPFINLAYTYDFFSSDIMVEGNHYTYQHAYFHTSFGIKLFSFFVEITVLPGMSYTGGFVINF